MTTHRDFTDEQRDEWQTLCDREAAAHKAMQDALADAGGWLAYALKNPDSAEWAREKADEVAGESIAWRAEWRGLLEQVKATDYGAFLGTQVDDRIAARRAVKDAGAA